MNEWPHSLILSFNKYLSRTHSVPGPVQTDGHNSKQSRQSSLPHGALILAGTHAFYALSTSDETMFIWKGLLGFKSKQESTPKEPPVLLCKNTWSWAAEGQYRGIWDLRWEKSQTKWLHSRGLSWLQLPH